jgi:hypothetical protein
MENMSFDELGLLLGVTEIRVVLHILIHGLQCDIPPSNPCNRMLVMV